MGQKQLETWTRERFGNTGQESITVHRRIGQWTEAEKAGLVTLAPQDRGGIVVSLTEKGRAVLTTR